MDQRFYPVTEDYFAETILPLIEGQYIWKGRPPRITHYQVFCAILYVLRTGTPWRDLPAVYGNWHSIYTRFNRGSERGLWWRILIILQQRRELTLNVVLGDLTTFKVHRHVGGQKGAIYQGPQQRRDNNQASSGDQR